MAYTSAPNIDLLPTHDDDDSDPSACRLVGLLGEGGTARVYLARHEGLGVPVAVKRLHPELANQSHLRDRLLAEADIARSVRHDHVVNVLDVVSDPDGESYFVMEHLAGEPVSARIAREGALPLSEALIIAVQVAGALDAIHARGIIHRDLKTENILVSLDKAGRLCAKLIDFGVAEILGTGGQLVSPGVVGTPESMAPEQAEGRTVDLRCDIYAFGVLLYEMMTGGAPFTGDDIPVLLARVISEAPVPPSETSGATRQYIPPPLESLILDCLAKRPDDRPQTIREVRERLQTIGLEYAEMTLAVERALSGRPAPALVVEDAPRRPALVVDTEPPPPIVQIEPRRRKAAMIVTPAVDADDVARADTVAVVVDSVETAWFAEGERQAAEERADAAYPSWSGQHAAVATRSSAGRLGRIAAATLVVAAAAAGVLGLLGSVIPFDLELLWFR
jgi:tRNA A-37 threonylcarbamoyl transferase component Bud32